MNTTTELDVKAYGRLLSKTVPTVIKTAEENLRMLAIVDKLMAKGEDNLTREEDALLELLVDLIHDFEEKHAIGKERTSQDGCFSSGPARDEGERPLASAGFEEPDFRASFGEESG